MNCVCTIGFGASNSIGMVPPYMSLRGQRSSARTNLTIMLEIASSRLTLLAMTLDNSQSCKHCKSSSIPHPHFNGVFADVSVPAKDLHGTICDHHHHICRASGGEIGINAGI